MRWRVHRDRRCLRARRRTAAALAQGARRVHLHPRGHVQVKLGDDLIEAPPGSFVFIPHDTPHTWQNVGDGLARFVAALIPASVEFEEFFLRYAELPPEERGIEAFGRLAAETRAMEVLGPPLAQSDPR